MANQHTEGVEQSGGAKAAEPREERTFANSEIRDYDVGFVAPWIGIGALVMAVARLAKL